MDDDTVELDPSTAVLVGLIVAEEGCKGCRAVCFVSYYYTVLRAVTGGCDIFSSCVRRLKAAYITLLLPDGAWLRLFTAGHQDVELLCTSS